MSTFNIELEEVPEVYHHSLWCEKWRPRRLEDFIGSPSVKETLQIWLENKDIPHIFLFGPPGCGKTSIAKILVKHIPCDSLFINASDENSVDDIRNKVQDFAMTMGFQPTKIVVQDECLDETTLVTVIRDGQVMKLPIKNLFPETDLVKSLNIKTEQTEWMPFTLMDKGYRETYSLQLSNGEVVICTGNHKWYVKDSQGNIIKMTVDDIIKNNISEIMSF